MWYELLFPFNRKILTLIKPTSGLWNKRLRPGTRFFDNFLSDWPLMDSEADKMHRIPAACVKETDQVFEIELSVSGYRKQDISVEVNNDMLRISGKRKDELKEENETYTRKEFSYGSFTRTFHLPESVKDSEISVKCMNEVLLPTLPKMGNGLPEWKDQRN